MSKHNNSLAGTDKRYLVGQGRMYDDGLHVQFAGSNGNREYGFAETLPVSQGVVDYVDRLAKPNDSLAGTKKGYFALQARARNSGEVHVQIPGYNGNRGYGFTFDVADSELWDFLRNNQ